MYVTNKVLLQYHAGIERCSNWQIFSIAILELHKLGVYVNQIAEKKKGVVYIIGGSKVHVCLIIAFLMFSYERNATGWNFNELLPCTENSPLCDTDVFCQNKCSFMLIGGHENWMSLQNKSPHPRDKNRRVNNGWVMGIGWQAVPSCLAVISAPHLTAH